MSSYILIGKDISLYKVKLEYGDTNIFGDGVGNIDCNRLRLKKNSNVKILAHGNIIDIKNSNSLFSPNTVASFEKMGMDYVHTLLLCSVKDESSLSSSFTALNTISNSEATNFVLASCYGGAAINDINMLPKWSTLITLNSPNHPLVGPLGHEIIIKSEYFDYKDNPFIQVAYYLFNNPDSTQFAIKHRSGIKIFKSSIDDFISESKSNFSQEEIRAWQIIQLNNFIDFCKEIKSQMNMLHAKNIKEFLKFVNNKNELLEQSALDRYQELLLVNIVLRGKFSLIDNVENINIVKDVMFINDISFLFWNIQEKNLAVLEKLIDYGVDINIIGNNDMGEVSALHFAIFTNSTESTKLLIDSGADVNIITTNKNSKCPALHYSIIMNSTESTKLLIDAGADVNSIVTIGDIEIPALHYSIQMNSIESIKLLMEHGANVNIKSSNNVSAVELASENNNFEAVCELLKVGAASDYLETGGYILDFISGAILFGLSVLSKVINNDYFTDLIRIGEEEMLFTKDPIEYILVHNDQVNSALNAMDNLMLHEYLAKLHPQILETKECLSQLNASVNGDLNILCGRDHFVQDQYDL